MTYLQRFVVVWRSGYSNIKSPVSRKRWVNKGPPSQPNRIVIDNPYINSAVKDPDIFRLQQPLCCRSWNVSGKVIRISSGQSTPTKALSAAATRNAQLRANPTADALTLACIRRRNQPRTQRSQPNQPQLLFSFKKLFKELTLESLNIFSSSFKS